MQNAYDRHRKVTFAASSPSSEKAKGGFPGLVEGAIESLVRTNPGTLLPVMSSQPADRARRSESQTHSNW